MRPSDKKQYIENVKRNFSQSSHLNRRICGNCGGKCCKRGGCGLMTCDVPELSINGIKRMLSTGKYSITFFCADVFGEVIHVPVMNAREINSDRVNNSSIRKPCALLGEKGCLLSDDERPTLGLLYIPKANDDCKMLVDSMEVFADWLPYRPMMEQVILEETGKTAMELFYSGCIQDAMTIRQKLDMNIELTYGEVFALNILEITGIIGILEE